MPLSRIEHYLVLTDDIDATRDFYRDVLGMAVGLRPPLGFPGYWLYLGETPCIHVAEWRTYTAHSNALGIPVTRRAQGTGPFDHVAFNATGFSEMKSELERRKIAFSVNEPRGVDLRQIFVDDPNGVKIELNYFGGSDVRSQG